MQSPEQSIRTIPALLDFCAQAYGSREVFRWREREEIRSATYARLAQDVGALTAYFAETTSRDAHIAILGSNSYQWLLGWFSALCAGRVAVPLDPQLPVADLLKMLERSDTELLLHDKDFGDVAGAFPRGSMRLDRLPGREGASGWPCAVQPDDLGMIVFTSGTTGEPKGVMLTHWNFLSNVLSGNRASYRFLGTMWEGHVSLAVIPFFHTASLNVGMLAQLPGGNTVCINSRLRNIQKDLVAFQPDCMFVVPLLAEGIYGQIWATAKKEGKDKLLRAMLGVSDALLRVKIDLRRRLFKRVLDAIGGKMFWMLCGGAALSEELVAGFFRLGIELVPAYGLTECSPGVTLSRYHKPLSVGQLMDCNEVRSEGGEIQVRGEHVFTGYYKDEQATREAFTPDGWFKTGDLGYMDEDGYLFITGRIKNLIILSNGKNVSPEPLEQELMDLPYVKEALVFEAGGEITAELFLDNEVPDDAVRLENDLLALNRQLPVYQRIARTILRDTEFPRSTTAKIIRK